MQIYVTVNTHTASPNPDEETKRWAAPALQPPHPFPSTALLHHFCSYSPSSLYPHITALSSTPFHPTIPPFLSPWPPDLPLNTSPPLLPAPPSVPPLHKPTLHWHHLSPSPHLPSYSPSTPSGGPPHVQRLGLLSRWSRASPPPPLPPPPPRLSAPPALRRTRASSLSCSLRSETGKNRDSLTEPSLRRRTPGDALGCAMVTACSSRARPSSSSVLCHWTLAGLSLRDTAALLSLRLSAAPSR